MNNNENNINGDINNQNQELNNSMTYMNKIHPNQVQTIPQENNNINTEEAYVEKKKRSKAPIFLLLFIILGVAAFLGYKTFIEKPYKIVIDSAFKTIKEAYLNTDSKKTTTSIKLNTTSSELSYLNDIKIDTEISFDANNNKELIKASYSESNKKILELSSFLEDNKIYVDLKELFDKKLYIDLSSIMGNNSPKMDKEDISYLCDLLSNMLKNALKDEKNNKSSITVKINNKDVKLTENKYIINAKNYNRVAKNMLDTIVDDEKAIDIISKYSGVDKTKLKNELFQARANLMTNNVSNNVEEEIGIIFYTKGILNKFAGFSLSYNNNKIFDYYMNDGYSHFEFKMSMDNTNSELFKLVVDGTENNKTINLTSSNQEVLKGTIVKNADNDYTTNINIQDMLTIQIDNKIQNITSLENFDTGNAITVDQLTEEDQTKIESNLQEVLKDSNLYKALYSGYLMDTYKNVFATKSKTLLQQAQEQWIKDTMNGTKDVKYSYVDGKVIKSCGKTIDINGNNDINYYIELDKSGNIVKYYLTDGTYYLKYDKSNLKDAAKGLEVYKIDIELENGEVDGDRMIHSLLDENKTEAVIGCGSFKLK